MSRHLNWAVWHGMKQRCNNENRSDYVYYGGAGIGYDPKWETLAGFNEDMGDRPSMSHTLDRRDGTKGYSKENCRWATRKEQSRNQKNNLRLNGILLVEEAELGHVKKATLYSRHYRGRPKTTDEERKRRVLIRDASTRLGMTAKAIYERLRRGWSFEKAATTPKDTSRMTKTSIPHNV